jgi:hypothetical protein
MPVVVEVFVTVVVDRCAGITAESADIRRDIDAAFVCTGSGAALDVLKAARFPIAAVAAPVMVLVTVT